jgi:hypothetical protein
MGTGFAGTGSPMTRYFAPISAAGPVRSGRFPFSIGVLKAPDKLMPIGMAFGVGRTNDGMAVWRLTVTAFDDDERSPTGIATPTPA